jgi:hypothetical protein
MTHARCFFPRSAASILLAGGCLLGACDESAAPGSPGDPRTVAIGVVIDRSGTQAWPGWMEAIRLAASHANQGLTESGFGMQFKIVSADSQNDPAVALPRAIELVTRQGARALVTDSSQNDVAINRTFYDGDAANDLAVPVQCAACTSGSINNPTAMDPDMATQAALRNEMRWNFRSTMATKLMAPVVVRLLGAGATQGDVNGDGKFKLAVYASDESFGRATSADLKTNLGKLFPSAEHVELLHPRDADPFNHDWSGDLDRLNEARPDAIAVATFPQLHGAIVSADALRPGARLFHFHNMRNQRAIEFARSAGNKQEGISHVVLDGSAGDDFRRAFEESGGLPVAFRDGVFYDTVLTLMLAAVIAAKDLPDPGALTGAQIRDAMLRTSEAGGELVKPGAAEFARAIGHIRAGRAINYAGASGPMDYDANQNIRNRLAHFRIDGMATVDLATFDCVQSDDCPALTP